MSSAMLTPPESGESPIVGPHEGAGFSAVHGGANPYTSVATHQTQASQQPHPHNIVEGIWSRFANEASGSREASASWPPSQPTESKAAVQQQIVSANQSAGDREICVEIAKLVASFRSDDAASEDIPQPTNSIPYRGLDYESLRALRAYIYGEEGGAHIDEEALLNCLEKAWREGMRADHDRIVEDIPSFIARERAFLTWIELKRHLAALERADKRRCLQLDPSSLLTICRLAYRRPFGCRNRASYPTTPYAHGRDRNAHGHVPRHWSRLWARSEHDRRQRRAFTASYCSACGRKVRSGDAVEEH